MSGLERLAVRLTPRGGREGIEGWARDGQGRAYLQIRIAAPPVDGQANAALIKFIARSLKRPTGAVRIASGHRARIKQLEIEGTDPAAMAAAFGSPEAV